MNNYMKASKTILLENNHMYEIAQSNNKEMNAAINDLSHEFKIDWNYKNYLQKYVIFPLYYNEGEFQKLNLFLIEGYKKSQKYSNQDIKI